MTNFNPLLGSPLNRLEEVGTPISYEFKNISTQVNNIIKITCHDNYLHNAISAYNPSNASTFYTDYNSPESPYLVKQLDPNTGEVSATGILMRYIVGDNTQTLYIQVKSGIFNLQNGIIFNNRKSENGRKIVLNSQDFSFGSSIKSVEILKNVMKLTFIYLTDDVTVPNSTQNKHHYNYGDYIFDGKIQIKHGVSSDLTTNPTLSSGTVLALFNSDTGANGETIKSYIVALDNAVLDQDINNGGSMDYQTAATNKDWWYMQDNDNLNGIPCGRHLISSVYWINIEKVAITPTLQTSLSNIVAYTYLDTTRSSDFYSNSKKYTKQFPMIESNEYLYIVGKMSDDGVTIDDSPSTKTNILNLLNEQQNITITDFASSAWNDSSTKNKYYNYIQSKITSGDCGDYCFSALTSSSYKNPEKTLYDNQSNLKITAGQAFWTGTISGSTMTVTSTGVGYTQLEVGQTVTTNASLSVNTIIPGTVVVSYNGKNAQNQDLYTITNTHSFAVAFDMTGISNPIDKVNYRIRLNAAPSAKTNWDGWIPENWTNAGLGYDVYNAGGTGGVYGEMDNDVTPTVSTWSFASPYSNRQFTITYVAGGFKPVLGQKVKLSSAAIASGVKIFSATTGAEITETTITNLNWTAIPTTTTFNIILEDIVCRSTSGGLPGVGFTVVEATLGQMASGLVFKKSKSRPKTFLTFGRIADSSLTSLYTTSDSKNILVSKITFSDPSCNNALNYTPVLNTNLADVYQYNYMSTAIKAGKETANKIEGDVLAWTASTKSLLTISSVPFKQELGTVYFSNAGCNTGFGGNSYDEQKSNLEQKTGIFANITQDYVGDNFTIGSKIIQNISLNNHAYVGSDYVVGDTVTQYINGVKTGDFIVTDFNTATTIGGLIVEPTTLTVKPLNNAKLDLRPNLDAVLLPSNISLNSLVIPQSTESVEWPWRLNRVIAIGSPDKIISNTEQSLPLSVNVDTLDYVEPNLFTVGNRVASAVASAAIGTCMISGIEYLGDNKYVLSLADIRPTSDYTFKYITENAINFSYGSTKLFKVIPESAKYNQIVVENIILNVSTRPSLSSITPSFGPTAGGTTLTLKGKNFINGSSVTIGPKPAINVVWVDSETITCKTPAETPGATQSWNTVLISGTNGNTGSGGIYLGFNYDNVLLNGNENPITVYAPITQTFLKDSLLYPGDILILSANGDATNAEISRAMVINTSLDVNDQTKTNILIERFNYNDITFSKDTKITKVIRGTASFDILKRVLSCEAFGEIKIDNLTKNGFIYSLQGGSIFESISTNTTIQTKKCIIGSAGSSTYNGAQLLSKNHFITGTSSTEGIVALDNVSGWGNTGVAIGNFSIDSGKYRIKNLETNTDSRRLKFNVVVNAPSPDYSNVTEQGIIYSYLTKSDVFRINSIKMNGDDLTDLFILDNGETKEVYGFSKIIFNDKKPGAISKLCDSFGIQIKTLSNLQSYLSTNEVLLDVIYSYFSHELQSGVVGPIIRQSYKYGVNSLIPIDDMGFVISGENNISVHKSSVIDFRPIYITTGLDPSVDPYSALGRDTVYIDNILLPSNSFSITANHYLGRQDSLYLTDGGEFVLEEGVPDLNPKAPTKILNNAMKLYDITIPSYTADVNKIRTKMIENRRYTMRDIGKIETRVKNLEYYSNLSLVEKKASDMVVTDSKGLTRSKNGIIVDNFDSFLISDAGNSDYNGCIHTKESYLRPPFMTSRFNFVPHTPSITSNDHKERKYPTNTLLPGENPIDILVALAHSRTESVGSGLYMLQPEITDKQFIIQPFASSPVSLTPFDTTKAIGRMTITPSVDDWIDNVKAPVLRVDPLSGFDKVFDDIISSLSNNNNGIFGTHYSDWTNQGQSYVVNKNDGHQVGGGNHDRYQEQSRSASKTSIKVSDTSIDLGNRITDISVAHWIRPQSIILYVSNLKPFTRVYVFLDDVNVDEYCSLIKARRTTIDSDPPNSPSDILILPFTQNPQSIITNSKGNITIKFDLAEGKYRTGEKTFVVTDSPINDKFGKNTTMYAVANFASSGLTVTSQDTIMAGKTFSETTTNWKEDRTAHIAHWYTDPVAQTFSVNEKLYPSGVFVSSIDVCFATKDPTQPVMAQLRPTVNGVPDSKKVYDNGNSFLPASQINALLEHDVVEIPNLSDATKSNRFIFDPPVYLVPGEHALVLHSNSEKYSVYAARIGEDSINMSGGKIVSQPYTGEFFASSNGSAWVADGTTDLTFAINLCVYAQDAKLDAPVQKVSYFMVETVPPAPLAQSGQFNLFENNIDRISYENFTIKPYYSDLKGTQTTFGLTLNSSISASDVFTYPKVDFDTTVNIPKRMGLSISNQGNAPQAGNNILLTVTSQIYDPYVSPVIDMKKSSIILVRNMIDTTELTASGSGLASIISEEILPKAPIKENTLSNLEPSRSRYITKIVTLADDFEALNCKAMLTMYKPAGTEVLVFVKTQPVGSTTNFDLEPYRLMNFTGNPVISVFEDDYKEIQFDLPEDIEKFNKFAFKICLFSTNSAIVPKIKDFTGIAVI